MPGLLTPGLVASVDLASVDLASVDLAEYGIKSSDFDTLWLLKKIKKTTVDVDMKANPALTLHEQILIFMTTR